MAMNPKLLRPRASGVHLEAAAWRTAVVANGGTVSGSTLSAVDKFCKDIDSAGIRDRFYRLNLFAGTGLNAVLVPLYRGQSRTGTQYGNTTDTNNGPFVSGDYTETGTGGGLIGNGSSKYLNTGLPQNVGGNTGHVSVYHRGSVANAAASFVRVSDGVDDIIGIDYSTGVASVRGFWGSAGTAAFGGSSGGHVIASRTSSTLIINYRNGTAEGTNGTGSVSPTLGTNAFFVFASNQNGTPSIYAAARLQGYSIGAALDATQAAAFSTALITFQTSLGRN